MANNFVAVPSDVLEKWLTDLGFERTVQYNEVVYKRVSTRHSDVWFKVYTSIRVGQTQVRGAGKDAIRACVVFDNGRGKTFGIGKFSPVCRVVSVDSILKRLKERLREAATRANEWIDQEEKRNAERKAQHPDIQWKNRFAERERRQESEAFLLDPDFQDPCSEPPDALFAGTGE